MAIAKVTLNGTTLIDITDTTATASDVASGKYFYTGDGVKTVGEGSGGGAETWTRPAEWPDYSKLRLEEDDIEAQFFTYDNREARSGITGYGGIFFYTSDGSKCNLDRVTIGATGTVTVLETLQVNHNADIKFTIPLDAGDYVCYRLTPTTGHITRISMAARTVGGYVNQRCVERYGRLPYCTAFNGTNGNRHWGCNFLVSDTILAMSTNVAEMDYSYSFALENLPTDKWETVIPSASIFRGCRSLKSFDFSKLDLTSITVFGYSFADAGFEEVDLSNNSMPVVTNIQSLLSGCVNLKKFKSPSSVGSTVTTDSDFLNNCVQLEVVEFPGTWTAPIQARFFNYCTGLKALILRADQVLTLGATGAVPFMAAGGGYTFVPQSLLDDYKAATNWSSLASYILPIEGSYWETHHADGSLIE